MEEPWACFSFPAGTTTRAAAAAVGCGHEQLSQADDGGEAGWKTRGFEARGDTIPSVVSVLP